MYSLTRNAMAEVGRERVQFACVRSSLKARGIREESVRTVLSDSAVSSTVVLFVERVQRGPSLCLPQILTPASVQIHPAEDEPDEHHEPGHMRFTHTDGKRRCLEGHAGPQWGD